VTASEWATGVSAENLGRLVMEHPFPDEQPLLSTINGSMSAGTARAEVLAIAAQLQAAGVKEHQAVAVRLPNGPAVITAMAGIWLAGAVFVPLNTLLPASEIEAVLEPTAPAALLDSEGLHTRANPATYEDAAAFILWTSGTTGRPKPIIHTHGGYRELLTRVLGPLSAKPDSNSRPRSPNLIPVSLALNAGIYNALFGLMAGAPLVIMDRFATDTFAELIRRFEIRSTVLPPAAIAMLNDDPDVGDLTPLRYVRSITAPLSPLQARRFTERFGSFVLNSYGQAEIGEVIGWTASDAKEHPEKIGAAGRPHAGVALKIVGDDGAALHAGSVGELLVRPPTMAAGYASGDDLTERVDDEGFLDTGDLAKIDVDGFVWIEGRKGDLINRGGNKIFPEEVEEVLLLDAAVDEVAVVGVPDDRLGQVPVAFVVSSETIESDALEALCRLHLVPYKVPVDFVGIDELPRSEIGKVLRSQLVDGYLG